MDEKEKLKTIPVREIIDATDAISVCEELGIEMKRYGTRISILCPEHNDTHFGSCFLNEHGYHCFACHASGDSISLVRHTLQLSFPEACRYVARVSGCEYLLDGTNNEDKPLHRPLPEKSVLNLLGLSETYSIRKVVETFDQNDPITGTRDMRRELVWEPTDKNGNGMYLFTEVAARRPMQELADEYPEMLDYIVLNKAIDLRNRYLKMLDYKSFSGEDSKEFKECCDQVVNICGLKSFNAVLRRLIRDVDAVICEYQYRYIANLAKGDEQLAMMPIPDFPKSGKEESKRVFGEKYRRKKIGL